MSDENKARRSATQVVFDGVDISEAVNADLISLTYVDNEEDEADDLQIKVADPERKWLTKWLDPLVNSAALDTSGMSASPNTSSSGSSGSGSSSNSSSGGGKTSYKVTASNGVNVRTNTTSKGKILGKLPFGTIVEVNKFSDGCAQIQYSGSTGWIRGENLKAVGNSGGGSSSASSSSSGASSGTANSSDGWAIGDAVIVTGSPQYTSYGEGKPGIPVTDYSGKVSHLNLRSGVPYPICVDYLGWFAENQVRKVNGSGGGTSSGSSGKGLKISAAIVRCNFNSDGADEILDCGQFELDSVDVSGPPNEVTIKGTSIAYSNSVRQVEKSKAWESVTLSQIASEIAENNGMVLMFYSALNPSYSRVEQYRQSDISFLSTLCKNAGCSLKITNNIIVIFNQSEYDQKAAVRTIKFGEGYTKYRLATNENNTYTSCRVYCTKNNGTVISKTVYVDKYQSSSNDKQCLSVCRNIGSIAEAETLAYKMLRLHNKYEFEASFTLPGDPSLTAGQTVELEGFGMWDGKYAIKQAKHALSHNGYTTQLTLRKALDAAAGESVTGLESSDTSDSELDEIALAVIRGDWDNGVKRKEKLTAAGYDYSAVQKRVNEMLGIK
ncbi:MAG: hypothetical protein NC299_08820 [Lachnospiraceae bacterium]|nr:hypothetical protein [Lachnospiraceae bacterium]